MNLNETDHLNEENEPALAWTVAAWARELVMSAETLRRRLRQSGLATPKGRRFTPKEVLKAVRCPLEVERARESKARADLLELKRRATERDLLPAKEVDAYLAQVLTMVRQAVSKLPDAMAEKTNPQDPTHSRAALSVWLEEFLASTAPQSGRGAR